MFQNFGITSFHRLHILFIFHSILFLCAILYWWIFCPNVIFNWYCRNYSSFTVLFYQNFDTFIFIFQDAGPMAHPVRPHSYIKVRIQIPSLLSICLQNSPIFPCYMPCKFVFIYIFSFLTDGQFLHRQASLFLELQIASLSYLKFYSCMMISCSVVANLSVILTILINF